MFAIDILKKALNGPVADTRRPPRIRALLAVESLESRELFSLSPVSPYAGRPFTSIVELQATFPDHRTFVGTGVMVDRFHVLTAGHVVYSYADGGFASRIQATPDLYGNSAPFGVAYMTYERTYSTFMNYNRANPGRTAPGDYDIALITLDRTIGDRTGWMSYGYDNNNADFAPGAILNTAGYPATGGYNGRYMEFSYGPTAGLSPNGLAIVYRQTSITAFAGQSGSPVWRYTPSNGASVVYGIHVGGDGIPSSMNFATRITQSIFNDLQNWRAADRTPFTSFAAGAQFAQSFSLIGSPFHSGNAQTAGAVSPVAPIGVVFADQLMGSVSVTTDRAPRFSFTSTLHDVAASSLSLSPPSWLFISSHTQPVTDIPQTTSVGHDSADGQRCSVAVLTVRTFDVGSPADGFTSSLEESTQN